MMRIFTGLGGGPRVGSGLKEGLTPGPGLPGEPGYGPP